MTNQEILTKAIEKALDRSWDMFDYNKWEWGVQKVEGTSNDWYRVKLTLNGSTQFIDMERIIYHDDFAKAIWGDELEYYDELDGVAENWKVHLQQMVIADDPIAYLGDNI